MKFSNKILLGFLGLIFLYLTAAFAELRMTGIPNIYDDKNSTAERVDFSAVRYLVVSNVDKQIHVTGSDRSAIEVRSLSGDFLSKVKYKVTGDTLTISGIESEATERVKISVIIPKTGLRGIAVNGSVLIVNGLEPESLSISQRAGSVWMSDCRVGKIELDIDHGYTDISRTTLDTLAATIERSQVNVFCSVSLVQGSIRNGAFLRVNNADEIQLKKDDSSRLNLLQ
jgi:hypothetical protein